MTFDHKAHTIAWQAKAAADKRLARSLKKKLHDHLDALAASEGKPARQFDVRVILYPHDSKADGDVSEE